MTVTQNRRGVLRPGTGSNFLASTIGANDAFSFGSSLIVEGGPKYYAYLHGETPPLQFGRSNAYAGGELLEAGRGTGFQFQKVSSLDFRFGVGALPPWPVVPEPASCDHKIANGNIPVGQNPSV